MGDKLYSKVAERRDSVKDICFAFRAPDTARRISVDGYALSWSAAGLLALKDVWLDAYRTVDNQHRTLPYASLRGLLEVMLPGVSRIERGMCLDPWSLKDERAAASPPPFVWAEADELALTKAAQEALGNWIPNYLVATFAQPGNASAAHIDRVYSLFSEDRLLIPTRYKADILPWGWTEDTGTTRNSNQDAFANLVHFAASAIARSAPFPGAGPIRKVVAVQSGRNGIASLVTDPITITGKGSFSLALQLEVVTFPGVHQPVLTVNVFKRRWLESLPDDSYLNGDVSGYAFPTSVGDRVASFFVARRRNADGSYRWEPDNGFHALQRHFDLPLGKWNGDSLARGEASNDDCQVRLVHRHGLKDSNLQINAGVPEIDKLQAFEAVAERLKPHGLFPLTDLVRLTTRHAAASRAAGMINAHTLLGAVLQSDDPTRDGEYTGDYLTQLGDEEVDRLLLKNFQFGLASIHPRDKISDSQRKKGKAAGDQSAELQEMIDSNAQAVVRLYGTQKPQLAILYDERASLSLKLLQSAVRVLWGTALEIKIHRLPEGTHGPRSEMPGSNETATGRFQLRVDAWNSLARSIAATKRQTLCLVVAPNFYATARDGRMAPDDQVNKPATRKALATVGGATVQFLLPVMQDNHGSIRLVDYLHRIQASLKELVFAHAGRIDGVAGAAFRCFGNGELAPREVLGITIVRRNSGRTRGNLDKTFLAIASRLILSSGQCELRYAHERRGQLHISQWLPFTRALGEIAGASPVQLASNARERGTRFMKFCETVIGEAVDAGAQPVVLIDSSNCARLWPWLADSRIDAAKIDIAERQWMQEDWRGARIVRIRQDLAPGIVRDKVTALASLPESEAASGNPRKKKFRLPTSPLAGSLYRLAAEQKSGCVTYLSVGGKTLHHNKRGLSCFREVQLPVKTQRDADGARVFAIKKFEPFTDQWPTPNPIEMVVTLRNAEDDPDGVAEFVESLRHGFGHYSEWTSLPAPLFFERVVRDYICGFALQEGNEESGDPS